MSEELRTKLEGYTDQQLNLMLKSASVSDERKEMATEILAEREANPEKSKAAPAAKAKPSRAKKEPGTGDKPKDEKGRGRKAMEYPTIADEDRRAVGDTVTFRQVKKTVKLEKGKYYEGIITVADKNCPKTGLPFYGLDVVGFEGLKTTKLHTSVLHSAEEVEASKANDAAMEEKATAKAAKAAAAPEKEEAPAEA